MDVKDGLPAFFPEIVHHTESFLVQSQLPRDLLDGEKDFAGKPLIIFLKLH
jgi:hypothetical protein